MSTPGRIGAKVLLAVASLFAMLSYGGLLIFLFLPLAFGYWWAVRNARGSERAAWLALSALAAAQWAWEVTYPVTEGQPSSWIIAVVAGVAMATALLRGSQYTLTRHPRP